MSIGISMFALLTCKGCDLACQTASCYTAHNFNTITQPSDWKAVTPPQVNPPPPTLLGFVGWDGRGGGCLWGRHSVAVDRPRFHPNFTSASYTSALTIKCLPSYPMLSLLSLQSYLNVFLCLLNQSLIFSISFIRFCFAYIRLI